MIPRSPSPLFTYGSKPRVSSDEEKASRRFRTLLLSMSTSTGLDKVQIVTSDEVLLLDRDLIFRRT